MLTDLLTVAISVTAQAALAQKHYIPPLHPQWLILPHANRSSNDARTTPRKCFGVERL